ncbi:hypothetical protein [Rubellimicrobium roseum]|uniref:Uncharacterized protein n=1 Tax=Rubellimicrobium roseum TaxID=687525 RepID=A0A5C4NE68_9RHOB|nr:hypothetical protein [Rubellimicrobium roseum]TNC72432.1 hypothetical protein FHG71_08580 [Rubellimicrobium roseum]
MRAFCLLALLAGPALAQDEGPPVREVEADLDGNGAAETYVLRDGGETTVDLEVRTTDGTRMVPGIAWTGRTPGTEPELALSPAGSVQVVSMNDAVGRDRWRLVLTLAHRGGDWRVAGITYDWRDTLDPAARWGGCDLNLLTGRGTATSPEGERAIVAPSPAPVLWDWQDTDLPDVLPAECFGG